MNQRVWPLPRRDVLVLFGIWLVGVLLDLAWVKQHQLPPAWDQGDHLSRALGFWQVLQHLAPFNAGWWHELWAQAPSYRGPLTYLVTAPLFSVLGPSYGTAILSNGLFQALLLLSLYGLGRLAGQRNGGLWAAFLAAVAPALLNQRTDYLIDFSLTAVISACWLLISWRHLGQMRRPWLASALAGLGLGVLVLTRPTGLLLLWLPLAWLLIRAIGQLLKRKGQLAGEAVLASWLAWLVAGGWFSQNWLTILSTVNNARRWGVLYQEGLEANTLEGWLYYPRLLPSMAGAWLVGVVVIGWSLSCWQRQAWPQLPGTPEQRWRTAWWLSFPVGALLLASLMSTKDVRFVLPLLPQLLLLLGLLISQAGRWLQGPVVVLGMAGWLATQFGIGPNLTGFPAHLPRQGQHWPLEEIVGTIRAQSPQQLSTLAVLPDHEFLNAFNLEAEGRRQQFRVAARQTVAPVEHLQDDLAGFDWFLLKGGNQGVMSDERQARLSTLVRQSPAFLEVQSWPLPDGSRAELVRRRELSLEVAPASCPAVQKPVLELGATAGTTRLIGTADHLAGSLLLLDGQDRAVGQGLVRPTPTAGGRTWPNCLAITERLQPSQRQPQGPPGTHPSKAALLLANGQRIPLKVVQQPSGTAADEQPQALMANRHQQLLELGRLLRAGELDELFQRVGRINQHDPEQRYLPDGEAILQARLTTDPRNLDLLYPLALAQALQRKADAAAVTLSRITQLDPGNANAHLGLGFVQLYRFKPWAAAEPLNSATLINPNDSTIKLIHAIQHAITGDIKALLAIGKK